MDLPATHHPLLLDLARDAIRAALTGSPLAPLPDDPVLAQPAGCFVSLHDLHTHRLRGCIGRLDATQPLGQVVRAMAEAVLEDPRFPDNPVTPADLPTLEIELSIISPLADAPNPEAFDPPTEGIYLSCLGRTGCFLPQVARETGWTKTQLLDRLCTEKLGLPASSWRTSDARLQKFTTTLVGPAPFLVGSRSGRE
ncbi:MAG TPA: AmmeMemoRadiSam system protein A [Tepidisphaeraceae bacterium]|nr:AmmeMemoRadiSam system protein A [Tepidisphaeraceae bacterium]